MIDWKKLHNLKEDREVIQEEINKLERKQEREEWKLFEQQDKELQAVEKKYQKLMVEMEKRHDKEHRALWLKGHRIARKISDIQSRVVEKRKKKR